MVRRWCVFKNCDSNTKYLGRGCYKAQTNISFFEFPGRNSKLFYLWLKCIKLDGKLLSNSALIWERHFSLEYIIRNAQSSIKKGEIFKGKRPKLNYNIAYPTQNLDFIEYSASETAGILTDALNLKNEYENFIENIPKHKKNKLNNNENLEFIKDFDQFLNHSKTEVWKK